MDDICAFLYLLLHYINVSRQAKEPDAFFPLMAADFWLFIFFSLHYTVTIVWKVQV